MDGVSNKTAAGKGLAIRTERLLLRSFTSVDITDEYVGWLNDKEVVRFSEQRHHVHTLESCQVYFSSINESDDLFFAIIDQRLGRHIGNVSCIMDYKNLVADIAILIGVKECWGRGLATEIYRELALFILQEKDFRKVTAGTMSVNRSMLAVLKNAGFETEAVRTRHVLVDGQEVDLILTARFR